MMDPVEAPQKRDVVEGCVLGVDDQIQQGDADQARGPVGNAEDWCEADVVGGHQGCPLDCEQRKEQAECHRVDGGQRQVHAPPPGRRRTPLPPRKQVLQKRHDGKYAGEGKEAHLIFVQDQKFQRGMSPVMRFPV